MFKIWSKKTKIASILGILSLGFLGTAYYLPQIISSNLGKAKLEAHLETLLGGRVSIGTLSLNWDGQQHCRQIQWTDEKNGIALTADALSINANLIDCLTYKDKALDVLVEGAKISCKANLSFIKIYDRRHFDLHFSPISALLQEGKITFERTQIDIAPSLQVVTWGTIDLDKNHMNMTLGLPPKTLRMLFKTGRLDKDFLLEIPISSKLSTRALKKKVISYFLKNGSAVKSLRTKNYSFLE